MARDLRGDAEAPAAGPRERSAVLRGSEWVVYNAASQRGTKIWRMRADGTGRSPVGSGVLDETAPTCSPDGRLVAYNVIEGRVEILYVKRFDGSGDRILYSDSSATHPVW
jgi:Tol biopolymer transport system component